MISRLETAQTHHEAYPDIRPSRIRIGLSSSQGDLMTVSKKNTTPRWECRTFAGNLASLEARIGLSLQIAAKRSSETYLLNSRTPHGAKLRNGELEIKRLERVDPTGLELWNPVFQNGFPLPAPLLQRAFMAFGLPTPMTERDQYSLDEFLIEIGRDATFRAVRVEKARRQFIFGGCMAELVRIRIGAIATDSFCVEDENPQKVLAALRELGLDSRANINFPKALARALEAA